MYIKPFIAVIEESTYPILLSKWRWDVRTKEHKKTTQQNSRLYGQRAIRIYTYTSGCEKDEQYSAPHSTYAHHQIFGENISGANNLPNIVLFACMLPPGRKIGSLRTV